jgi:hypothetical protein
MHKNIKTITIIKHLLRRPLLSIQRFLKFTHRILTTGIIGKCFFYLKWTCVILGILSVILIYYYNIKLQNYINLTQLAAISALSRLQIYLTQFVNYIVEYLGYDIKPDVEIPNETITPRDEKLTNEEFVSTIQNLQRVGHRADEILESLRDKPIIDKGTPEYESLKDLYINGPKDPESWTEWFNNHKKTIYIFGGVIVFVTIGGVVYWISEGSYETFANKFTDLTTGLIGFFVSSSSRRDVEIPDTEDESITENEKKINKLKKSLDRYLESKDYVKGQIESLENLKSKNNHLYTSSDEQALTQMKERFVELDQKIDKLSRAYEAKTGDKYLEIRNSQIQLSDSRTKFPENDYNIKRIKQDLEYLDGRKNRLLKEIKEFEEYQEKNPNEQISKFNVEAYEKNRHDLININNKIDNSSDNLRNRINELNSEFFKKLDEDENTKQQDNVFNSHFDSVKNLFSELTAKLNKSDKTSTNNSEEKDDDCDSNKAWSGVKSQNNSAAQSEQGSRPSTPVASSSGLHDSFGHETPAGVSTPKVKPTVELPDSENPFETQTETSDNKSNKVTYNGVTYDYEWYYGNAQGEIMNNIKFAQSLLNSDNLSESDRLDVRSKLEEYKDKLDNIAKKDSNNQEDENNQKDGTPLYSSFYNLFSPNKNDWDESDYKLLDKLINKGIVNIEDRDKIIADHPYLPSIETLKAYKDEYKLSKIMDDEDKSTVQINDTTFSKLKIKGYEVTSMFEEWSDENKLKLKKLLDNNEISKNQYNKIINKYYIFPSEETLNFYINEHKQDADTSLISNTSTVVEDKSETEIEIAKDTIDVIEGNSYRDLYYYYSEISYFELLNDVELYKNVKNTDELPDILNRLLEKRSENILTKNNLEATLKYFNKDSFESFDNYNFEDFKKVYLKLKENNEEIPESVRNRAIELGIENNNSITDNIKDISNLGITAFLAKFLLSSLVLLLFLLGIVFFISGSGSVILTKFDVIEIDVE